MKTIDLNADVGEGFDDGPLLPYLSSVNIACGGHAGSLSLMTSVARSCRDLGIKIGAHPGYEDPENFGRKALTITDEQLRRSIYDQVCRLRDILAELNSILSHVKPHGALYNQACLDPVIARGIAETVRTIDPRLAIMCPESSSLAIEAHRCQLQVIAEGFTDRAYMRDGSLTPRSLDGSVYKDPAQASAQAIALAKGEPFPCFDGGQIRVAASSLCVHGDSPNALRMTQLVRDALMKEGFEIKPYTI